MTEIVAPTSPDHAHGPPGSLRELLHLAFPLVISAGSLSLMHVVDRAFLSWLGVNELAASMPAAMLNWTSMSLGFGIAGYTNAFVSQYEGAGRKDRVVTAIWHGLFVAFINGVMLLPLILLAPWMFSLMGHSEEVQALEVEYFSYLCPVAIPTLLNTVLAAFFTCRRRTIVVMVVDLVISVLNGLLAWLLIFGIWGFPALGIRGAALATLFSMSFGTILFVILMIRDARAHGYPLFRNLQFDFGLLKRMVRYGFPNGVQMFLDVAAFTVFIALTGRLGTNEQAATNLAFTLNSLAFIPIIGMGTAVMTLVGLRVGEGRTDLAARTVWKAFGFSGTYMLLFAALYLSAPDLILAPFIHGHPEQFQEIRPIVIRLLQYVAVYTFFDAMAIVFGSAIRGAGDTLFSLIFSVTGSWIFLVAPTVLIIKFEGGLDACWMACAIFVIVLGTGFLLRFLQGKWKSMRVIEREAGDVQAA